MPPPEMPIAPRRLVSNSGAGFQVIDQAQAIAYADADHRGAQVEGEHGHMGTGRRRSLAAFQIGEIGLALAKARNFWGSHGKASAAQGHAEVLVVPVGLVALAAILPQTDDVLDAVPVAVESHDRGQGAGGTFGQQNVHRHLRVGTGAQDYFLPRIIAFVDFFYFARCQIRLIASF